MSARATAIGITMVAAALICTASAAMGDDIADLWHGLAWGSSSRAVYARFGSRALPLPSLIDFGDAYTDVVLRDVMVGGVSLIAFFQMDKRGGGLKRIQLERPRHGVNPPAARAVLGALEAEYGAPDTLCGAGPRPSNGYQAAGERLWWRDGAVIRAIFRDTTIEAFEGCLAGDPSAGPCGLTGRLLVRISPPSVDGGACPAPPQRG